MTLESGNLHVFGYGSLIFKPPPHTLAASESEIHTLALKHRYISTSYITQAPGFLKGYVRRFAQNSHDHRGTPEDPGVVVTLIHKKDWDAFSSSDEYPDKDIVWGIAYTIDPMYASDVRKYLDHREQDGFTPEWLDVHGFRDGQETVVISNALCYVGQNNNPSFIGSHPIDYLAERIWRSVGPSGPNKDYLFKLAKAVRELAPESYDSHLFALESRVRELAEGAGEE